MYICQECNKQFREGEGVEHEDEHGLYFFCSMECFKEWYHSKGESHE